MGELSRHAREVARLASEYREKGFDVTVGGRLGAIEMDLLAVRGDKKIAVLVTVPTDGPDRSSIKLQDLEKELGAGDWELQMVLIRDELPRFDYGSADPAPIEARLQRARDLAATDPEAALLLAWSMFEAAARRALVREAAATTAETPVGLAKQLVHHGLLGNDDLLELLSIAQRRNDVSHGTAATNVAPGVVDHLASWGHELLQVA